MSDDNRRPDRLPDPSRNGDAGGFVPLVPGRRWIKLTIGIVLGIALAIVPILVVGTDRVFDTGDRPFWIAFVANFCVGVGSLVLYVL